MDFWVLPSLIAVAIITGLTFYVLVRPPPSPLAPSTTATLASILLFAIGDTATYFSTDRNSAWLATSIAFTGLMLVAPTFWMLAHRFSEALGHPLPWARTRWLYLPFLIFALLWIALITNPMHGQFLTLKLSSHNEHHWIWCIYICSSYICISASCLIYANLCLRVGSKIIRQRILIMLSAPVIVIASNLVHMTPAIALPFNPTAAALAATGVLFFFGIYRVGLFSLNPVAMSAIINQQPNGIVVTDMAGTLIHWNDAAEQALQSTLSASEENFDFWLSNQLNVDGTNQPLSVHELKAKIENLGIGEVIPLFNLHHHPDTWVQVRVDNILSRRDHKIARSYFIRNVSNYVQEETERRNLEHKMFQSQKLEGIGLLAGGVAHDFNNLLMAIRGNAELLATDRKLDDTARDRIQVIETVADRAARLTKKLLMYSGDAPLARTPCDLSQLVQDTSELIRTALLPKQLALSLELTENCRIQGDEAQLEQVLLNLAMNAAESYEGNSGEVIIRTFIANPTHADPGRCLHSVENLDTDFVVLEVVDTGCGMSPDTIDRIVDPFFSSKSQGRGLGLSAALGIVRGHNGGVYVTSDEGQGTSFCALFPKQSAVAS